MNAKSSDAQFIVAFYKDCKAILQSDQLNISATKKQKALLKELKRVDSTVKELQDIKTGTDLEVSKITSQIEQLEFDTNQLLDRARARLS